MKNKIMSAEEAVKVIQDGDTLTCTGFIDALFPEKLGTYLEKRFKETGKPRDLTIFFSDGVGDTWGNKGLNHFAHEGMVKELIGTHFGVCRNLGKLAEEEKVECYIFPLGQITNLFQAIAAKSPGLISPIGLDTFVDPNLEGGKMNSISKKNYVERIEIDGSPYLFYKSIPMNVCLLRGTTADELGNITMEHEAIILDTMAIVQGVKACGGKVIFQVERLAKKHSLKPHDVKIPGFLVDGIVVAEPEYHYQTLTQRYNPYYSGEIIAPGGSLEPMSFDYTKVMARRAAREIKNGNIINLGIGMAAKVATILEEEGRRNEVIMTVESGIIGGVPQFGYDFGTGLNPDSIISQNDQFRNYDGGCLDITCLGMAEVDKFGNVNVSKFNNNIIGCGGFIDISQTADKVIFIGTLTYKGLDIEANNKGIQINKDGQVMKFKDEVEQITFSGRRAKKNGQKVLYITDRCVFELRDGKMTLIEIAPGVNIEKDILNKMEFKPEITSDIKLMDSSLYIK
jgi:propionate CoA-transferase